ncbi:MAG: TRAP transporter permease, partial [Chloroflexi bacterium]|nr:TRAP transporter permease [Chloroflexota bacterium]
MAKIEPVPTEELQPTAEQVERIVAQYEVSARVRDVVGLLAVIVSGLCIAMSVYHLYATTFATPHAMTLRAIHVGFVLTLIFLLYPTRYRQGEVTRIPSPLDFLLIAISLVFNAYIVINLDDILTRAGAYTQTDFIMGIIALVVCLEAGRRATGLMMPGLALIFLLYPWLGFLMPGILNIRPFDWERISNYMYLTTEGIYGLATGVSATYVFMFVLFGSFLVRTGTGQLFIDLALALFGHTTGGPAKVAVFASGFMGTINGSAIANTASTGIFTIPLMKRTGFAPHTAGAVEAAASTGGQIMPPVMGAAAFIMAEFIGVPYLDIAVAATLPAVLYYFSLLAMVHLEALKQGVKPVPKSDLPRPWPLLRERGLLLLPVAVVLYVLFQGYTPTYAAVIGIVAAILSGLVRRETRVSPRVYVDALIWGARDALPVAIACVLVGYVMGAVSLTGTGLKIAGAIVALAQDSLFWTLVLTMLASIVLGTGLPTTATYIVLATMAAPALKTFGITDIPSHLFIFYYGIIADLTPPIALAAMVGAGIANADPDKTGWEATRLALAGFLIPFMFVYSPAMLLLGQSLPDIVLICVTSVVGVIALAIGVQGYLFAPLPIWQRGLALAAAL